MNKAPKHLDHMALSASAGTGKTYWLSSRYIALLANGVEPGRIVALTFSRKAAGEIFDRILLRLAEACISDEKLKELNQSLKHRDMAEPISSRRAAEILQVLVKSLSCLQVGTLDSFFLRVVRAFPFEFGISGQVSIMDEHFLDSQNEQILDQILSGSRITQKTFRQLATDLRLASFGTPLKRIRTMLKTLIEEYHDHYLSSPSPDTWGAARKIWPRGSQWIPAKSFTEKELEVLLKHADPPKDWEETLHALYQHTPGLPFTDAIQRRLANIINQRDELQHGKGDFRWSRSKIHLSGDEATGLHHLLEYIVGRDFEARLRKTASIYDLIRLYEDIYDAKLRQGGRLSFADVLLLLVGGADINNPLPLLSCQETAATNRLYIDYRLDSALDHWLIDEFQDTSTSQWTALANLADEVLQCTDGSRTFFYVGDVKQAIYGWREGDARLFDLLPAIYPQIHKEQLAQSWRSSRAIIETVNKVFEDLAHKNDIPSEVATRWAAAWKRHEPAPPLRDLPGYSVLYSLPKRGKHGVDVSLERDARCDKLIDLISSMSQRNNISRAVLVQKRNFGYTVLDRLRNAGIEAQWGGAEQIADNPLASALLDLLKLAQHPGDMYSRVHIMMTPLSEVIRARKLTVERVGLSILRDIHDHGFAHVLTSWWDSLKDVDPTTESGYAEDIVEGLIGAALDFDATGDHDVLRFLQFLKRYELKQGNNANAVQVLTIHRAKGLEYDAVFLPDLEGSKSILECMDTELLVEKADDIQRTTRWVLCSPPRDFAKIDPILEQGFRRLDHESLYERMCVLYVAMTRARHALYMITTAPGKSSRALYLSHLVRNAFQSPTDTPGENPCYEDGDPDWFMHCGHPPSVTPACSKAIKQEKPIHAPRSLRMERQIPSKEEEYSTSASACFSLSAKAATDYGTAIHALFEKISWLDECDINQCIDDWKQEQSLHKNILAKIVTEFQKAICSPKVKALLSKPGEPATLWREQRFEIVWEAKWVSGCFDRVSFAKDPSGQPIKVQIVDFKSDNVASSPEAAERALSYKPQIELYRKSLARMLDVLPKQVGAELLFTKTGDVVSL